MGYLLSPVTGKELNVLESIRTIYDPAFKLSCEIYTNQVISTKKIDQTVPSQYKISWFKVFGFLIVILALLIAVLKTIKNFKK